MKKISIGDNMKEGPFRSGISDLVEYGEGAVVSRTMIDRSSGTMTAFSFDEGQGLSEHTAPYDAVVQILEGSATVTISGTEYDMTEGDMIIMPANESHSIHAMTRFKMLLTMIRG